MTADTEDSTNQELVIRSRDCSDPVRPAPSGKDSLASHCAYIDRCRRRCYRYSEGHCLALGLHCRPANTRVAVAATGTEGLRLAAAWQTPATPPPLTPPPQSRDSASHGRHLLFNACCHYHLIMVVSLYLDLLSLLNNNV
ncbi:uncharacterized protein LOC123502275 isoform X2 [Portunus trituberculatus]|uniref:uncharacterized protein LOC123502275 isoform X2 n=1 Tax=Portunus trituberculatus TaxID=210409 RepID=UPI001E1CDB6C|nr:uncharacterized protein LOC123502275 isoform X2 [Portunus trituberculatus]XP_045107432.1 uncharacterized protein LOC123502275 isoform X2 [Portunus trituberculatus]XP_045107433.1 uncharacterized protein LOC123502275 isoform X2 [Portunus trituberculatus]XP_045107434.1 uncharacterized protein LOC123502275 isoform X2 [Portunus trituberculatus]